MEDLDGEFEDLGFWFWRVCVWEGGVGGVSEHAQGILMGDFVEVRIALSFLWVWV